MADRLEQREGGQQLTRTIRKKDGTLKMSSLMVPSKPNISFA